MVNFVVKIKVRCSENFLESVVFGGSLCLLAWSRTTGRALDLPGTVPGLSAPGGIAGLRLCTSCRPLLKAKIVPIFSEIFALLEN